SPRRARLSPISSWRAAWWARGVIPRSIPLLRRILSALFAITMLAAVGCGGGTSSAEVSLTGAVESLFAGPFAWTVTVEADRSSLNELGEGAREAADFLAGLRVSGVVDGNEAARLSISALGVDNIAELLFMG